LKNRIIFNFFVRLLILSCVGTCLTSCASTSFVDVIKHRLDENDSAIIIVPSFNYQNSSNGVAELPIIVFGDKSNKWGRLRLVWNGEYKSKVFSISLTPDQRKAALTCRDSEFKRSSVYYGDIKTTLTPIFTDRNSWGASFSPDGKYLALFTGQNTQETEYNKKAYFLMFYDISSDNIMNKIEINGSLSNPMETGQLVSWLPDSKRVVFSYHDVSSKENKEQSVIAIADVNESQLDRVTLGTSPISAPDGKNILFGSKRWYLRHDMFYNLTTGLPERVQENANKFRPTFGFDKSIADLQSMAPYPLTCYIDEDHYLIFSDKYVWTYDQECDCWGKIFYWPDRSHRYGLQTFFIEKLNDLLMSNVIIWE